MTEFRASRPENGAEIACVAAGVEDIEPAPMDGQEKMRIRAAAFRAIDIYPGPVGELISRELLTWEDFGYRLGGNRMVMDLVEHVLHEWQVRTDVA